MNKNEIPKVFISYSWDSEIHKEHVLALADKLCIDGIDCTIDRYHQESNTPKEDWPLWMRKRVEESKYVLVICTKTYKERFMQEGDPNRGFGVNYESVIARKSIYKNRSQNNKFIAIVFQTNDRQYVPEEFDDTVYDLSNCNLEDSDLIKKDNQYNILYRHLTGQPSVIKPNVGIRKNMPPINSKPSVKKETSLNSEINDTQTEINNLFLNQRVVYNLIIKWLVPQKHNIVTSTMAQLNAFPGVGKTKIAYIIAEYAKNIGYDTVYINLWKETDSYYDDIMLKLDAHYSTHFDNINVAELNSLLDKKVLIIIDDFQYALKKNNTLKKDVNFLKNLTRTKKVGKILFVSNKKINFEAREGEVIVFRPVKIEENDIVHFFKNELKQKGFEDRIPNNEIGKVLKVLNYNPRAVKIFISQFEHIVDYEDILSKIPESPLDLDDIEINRTFLYHLEEQLLSDSLKKLDTDSKDILERLSIYRTNIPSDIFKKSKKYLDIGIDDIENIKITLINSLYIETKKNWYHLNSIVKEILIRKINDNTRVKLHSLASNYYARHFENMQTVKNKKLGNEFIEARYHMRRSNQIERLSKISMKYTTYLLSEINQNAKPPSNSNELNERIVLLRALFEHGGPDKLAFHYTRCLLHRNKGNDCKEALKFFDNIKYLGNKNMTKTFLELTRIAYGIDSAIQKGEKLLIPLIGAGADDIYIYLSRLYETRSEIVEAIELLKEGIKNMPSEKSVFSLYHEASRLLDNIDRTEEAIELLKEGIKNIPVENSVFSLYHEASRLLDKIDKTDEAIELLKKGIKNIPVRNNVFSLYQEASRLLNKIDKTDESFDLLLNGVKKIPEQYAKHKITESALSLASSKQNVEWINRILNLNLCEYSCILAEIIKYQIQEEWLKSTNKFNLNIDKKYIRIYIQSAFSFLCAGKHAKAQEIFTYLDIEHRKDCAFSWLACFIALKNGNQVLAHKIYKIFKGLDEVSIPTVFDLLKDWQKSKNEKTEVFYVFPYLPAIISINQ